MTLSDFGASSSSHPVPSTAIGEAVGDVLEQVGTGADLVIVFATSHLTGTFDELLHVVDAVLRPRVLLGATGSAVSGNGCDSERQQSVSVWSGRVGRVVPFVLHSVSADGTGRGKSPTGHDSDGDVTVSSSIDLEPVAHAGTAMLLLADPFSFPVPEWLEAVHAEWPDLPVVGGYVSAAKARNGNRMAVGKQVVTSGAVGVIFRGSRRIDTIVAQGCRPIGSAFTVTRSERNVVVELGGAPAITRLDEIVATLPEHLRIPLRSGVHLGIVIDERRLDFGVGDFLIRTVLGVDRANGAIAVDQEIPVGSIVQFQTHDAEAATREFEQRIVDSVNEAKSNGTPVRGAVLFRSTRRGSSFFGQAAGDASALYDLIAVPTIGLACAGEFGPVDNRNFVHTFASTVVLFS